MHSTNSTLHSGDTMNLVKVDSIEMFIGKEIVYNLIIKILQRKLWYNIDSLCSFAYGAAIILFFEG